MKPSKEQQPPIALPTEYQCVICGGKIRRIKGMTSLAWIKSVATWCQEHRDKHYEEISQ